MRAEFLARPPAHTRVIGIPGSGKTTLLAERWRALSARGHRPGIVAFGQAHRERLLERVIPPGGAHLGAHPVTTHAMIAAVVLDATSPARPRTLRDVDELLVLGRLLRREPALLSSDLSTISGSTSFLRDILVALHALAQHGLSASAARDCARDCANPRARDVLVVYARYQEVCRERGLVSFYDAAWRAAERFDGGGVESPLAAFDVVLIDDFHDLDAGQYRLLTRLVPPDGPIALEVFGDPTGARFSFRGTSDRYLKERFQRDYAATVIELGAPQSPDVALTKTIANLVALTSTGAQAPPADPAGDLPLFANASATPPATHAARAERPCVVTLLIAADEIAEAQAVAARARAMIDAGTPPRDIAVIARDADRSRSVLQMACYEYGVPLEVGGHEDGAAEDFLRSLLGALGSDADGHFAEELAASPFHPSLSDGVDGEQLLRTLKRDYTPRGGGLDVERLLCDRVVPVLTGDDTAAYNALAAVTDEWQRYREVVEHAGGGASLDEFRATYLAERANGAGGGNRIQLISARESSGRTFHTTIVCGCAEGFFPGASARDGYIPLHALARAVEPANADAAHDIAARLDETTVERAENALFLTALTRATDALVMIAPARIGGESTLPSRVLAVDERPFAMEFVERGTSPCARAALAVARTLPDTARAQRLRAMDRMAGWWVTPAAPERYPRIASFSMSASKLNSYARCERQFFYRNILKMQEPESIYLKVGSLVHDALREIIPPGATGDEVRAALRDTGTREIAERLVSAAMGDVGTWMRDLSVRYLEDMLASVAALEEAREGAYRVRLQEEAVEGEIEGMPIRGRFDRIDDVEGLGRVVIDYKTSGSIAKTYPTLVDKIETEYWQIPVYAAMTALVDVAAAGFVYYALPPGEESFAAGVQLAPGNLPAPIPLGSRRPHRYGPVATETVARAMAHAVEIHRSIVEGDCRYERVANMGICPNCHFARICQRSRASI